MPAYAGPHANRSGDVVATLRLLTYLAAAIALMVFDHRGGWLAALRQQGETVMQPVWWLAGLPGRIGDSARSTARTQASLSEENRALRNALLINGARMARLRTAAAENQRIRGLLGAAQRGRLNVQLMPILDIDLDPSRQRLMLDGGRNQGASVGQTVIDAGGLVGQIIATTQTTSTVLLLTDPAHALPVEVGRSGVRLIAYGNGRSDRLTLANVPLSSDVKVGDSIVTSGLGGRFPAGFAVGTIVALRPDDSRAFLVGEVEPAAQLDRGRDVLLLREGPLLAAAGGAAVVVDPGAPGVAIGARAFAPPESVPPQAAEGSGDAAPRVPTDAPSAATPAGADAPAPAEPAQ